jgi:osmotically-inducible protein OsmY
MITVKYNSQVFAATMVVLLLFGGVCTCASADDDDMLAKKIKTVLLLHDNVSAVKTKISVKDGTVTLRGEADNQAQKDLTEVYADDVKGVKDVDNFMTVKPAAGKPDKTVYSFIDDASITSQIETALVFHKSTSVFRTGVKTKNGVVTLSGKVNNAAEKDLVAKFASDIEGVKKVINNLTIE